jgi:Fe-S cluster assembly protein SufD
MSASQSWLADWRGEANENALRLGLPTSRQEAWKYTALPPVWSIDKLRARPGTGEAQKFQTEIKNAITLDFVDGKYIPAALPKLPAGVIVMPLSEAIAKNNEIVRRTFSNSTPGKTRSLVALNMAEFTDGLLIYVPHGVILTQPIFMHSHSRTDSINHLRVLVHVEADAEATLVQHHTADDNAFTNIVHEFDIGTRARVNHYRLQDDSATATHFTFTESQLAEEAELDHFSLNLGARLSRHEISTRLLGDGAACHVNAAALLGGTQHADFTSIIDHQCEGGQSRQTVKNVLGGKSRAVFQGKIHVHPHAQKTDGYQMNQALLLSPQAEMDAKPELEIYADDVKCSHGATVGQLDATAMFYLRSRGLPAELARALLVEAFLADAVNLISQDEIQDIFMAALQAKQAEIADAAAH